MEKELRLMCVLAHPDDESLGTGGALAKYAAEGVETHLVTATRGERGRCGTGNSEGKKSPGPEAVGKMREAELLAAAEELGIREVNFLDYMDADLDRADPVEAIARIVTHLRRVRPQVVITFGPDGGYGHPDHIAISQFATAAMVAAADPNFESRNPSQAPLEPHAVSKLYYMAWTPGKWAAYQSALRELTSTVDSVVRRATPWPDWEVTTVLDTSAYWSTVWRAVCCHKTQMSIYKQLANLSEEHHQGLWGVQEYYRVFSLVNGGRKRETDLFEGLREGLCE